MDEYWDDVIKRYEKGGFDWVTWSQSLNSVEKKIIRLIRGPIKSELERLGVAVGIYYQPIHPDYVIWGDYGTDSFSDEFGIYVDKYIIVEFWVDIRTDRFVPFLKDGLYIKHNLGKVQDRALAIFKHYLGKYFYWDGDSKKSFRIGV